MTHEVWPGPRLVMVGCSDCGEVKFVKFEPGGQKEPESHCDHCGGKMRTGSESEEYREKNKRYIYTS